MAAKRRDQRARDRGVVSVLSVLFSVLLLTFLALSINVGRLMETRGDLQHAADTAALAAMEILDNKPTGVAAGRTSVDFDASSARSIQQMAQRFASKYQMAGGVGQTATVNTSLGGSITADDFVVGFWHEKSGAFERCVFSNMGLCNTAGDQPFEAKPGGPGGSQYDRLAVNAIKVTTRYTLPPFLSGITGQGNTDMRAHSIAIGRRQRIRFALPFAVSSCQPVDAVLPGPYVPNSLVTPGPGTDGFVCNGGPRTVLFRSRVEPDVYGPGGPGGLPEAEGLTRVDTIGDGDPGARSDYRDWVRRETQDWQCAGRPGMHVAGVADVPPDKRPDLGPIIDGLLGIREEGDPPVGACALGQILVTPMIAVDNNGCPDPTGEWPYRSTSTFGKARVFTYVNVRFNHITCADGTVIDPPGAAGNPCDVAPPAMLRDCSGPPDQANDLRIQAQILCEAPVPTGPGPTSSPARLVR